MAFGFRPVRRIDGSPYNGDVNEYRIAAATAAIYLGTPVKWHTDGTIISCAAGEPHVGILQGCRFNAPGVKIPFSPYWPATAAATDIVALVADDPNLIFEVETATAFGAVVDPTVRGKVADLVATSAGNAVTGQSGYQLGAAKTGATEAVYHILRAHPNHVSGATLQIVEVIAVKHGLLAVTSRA